MTDTLPAASALVAALWRYPVKSMMGEELNASDVTERGLLGDRAFALVDRSTGKVASAKNPRLWPSLFAFRAALAEPTPGGAAVRITLPDGRATASMHDDVDEVLTATLGRAVRLEAAASGPPTLEEYWPDLEGLPHREAVTDEAIAAAAPPGTFFDYAAVHVLTTSTIDCLRGLYPAGRFEARRFRPNIVVEVPGGEGFVEDGWVGRTLAVGEEVRLSVVGPCPRCVMTTLAQGDLPRDLGILRTAVRHNGGGVGVYATVLRGGRIRRGDVVTVA